MCARACTYREREGGGGEREGERERERERITQRERERVDHPHTHTHTERGSHKERERGGGGREGGSHKEREEGRDLMGLTEIDARGLKPHQHTYESQGLICLDHRSTSPSFWILTPGQPVLVLTLLLFAGCLTSQQHVSVFQGRIYTDNFTCCHTQIEVADQTFNLTQSPYTGTGPTSPSTDPITPGAGQGSQWSANFKVTGMTRPRKSILAQAGFEPGILPSRGGRLNR